MQIEYKLNLTAFNENKLKEFVKEGIITRFEYINELNKRSEENRLDQELRERLMKGVLDGKQSS